MPSSSVGPDEIELAYQDFGDPAHPALLLVMGLGTQMLGWPEPFCQLLADEGFHVVRFDNRDVGRSTHLDGLPAPPAAAIALHRRRPAYTLQDLAGDTIGLIETLELSRVHLVGASMGGFISQLVAIRRPDLVSSLTLIMTSTGSRRVGRPSAKVLTDVLRRTAPTDRDSTIQANREVFRLIGSPGYALDEDYLADLAGQSYDRGHNPLGQLRQLGAVAAQTDRTRDLAALDVPTVVMHGLSDPLVNASGGLAVARAIPGARFVGFSGMGHDLPRPLWPQFVDEIVGVAARAGFERRRS